MSKEKDQGPIPITSVDPQELVQIRDRIDADLQRLAGNNTALQRAAALYGASGQAIETLAASKEGQPIMLPLTSSLYVSGTLASVDKVLMDVGTGYYIEMPSEDGVDFCKRKVTKLKENLESLSQVMREKQSQVMQCNQVLSMKMAAAQQAQAQAQAQAQGQTSTAK